MTTPAWTAVRDFIPPDLDPLTIYHWEPNANSGKPILAALEKGVESRSTPAPGTFPLG